MRASTLFSGFLLSIAFPCSLAIAQRGDDSFKAPDTLVLKNGSVVHGLIIKNTRDEVLIQEQFGENTYAKADIVRIRDEADVGMEFTEGLKRGDLPSWRTIANDLRTNDRIRSMVEIPATIIDAGEFKNVPYKSFRVNGNVELNVYGDPEDPAGLEIGIYGPKRGNRKLQGVLRSYLAGFLTNRSEVAALYRLPLTGGVETAGELTIEVTPPSAPDAYGAWWISLYNRRDLAAARLDDDDYARLVRPMNEVLDARGRVKANAWSAHEMDMSARMDEDEGVLLRGFFRDKNGDFRLITGAAERVN